MSLTSISTESIQGFDWLLELIDFRCQELFASKVTTSSPLPFIESASAYPYYESTLDCHDGAGQSTMSRNLGFFP